MSARRWWARSPLVHFALLGGALFAGRAALDHKAPDTSPPPRAAIVIPGDRVLAQRAGFAERWGRPPTPEQLGALVEQAVQDEMLYREARRLALDLGDASVRRRLLEKIRSVSDRPGRPEPELLREAVQLGLDDDLVIRRLLAQKMRLVLQDTSMDRPIRDADLGEWTERHRDALLQPETITFSHVFLADGPSGDRSAEARAILAGFDGPGTAAPDERRVADLSDSFPLGTRLRSYTRAQLRGRFGDTFADRVFALAPGAWSGPIASPYGLHLVRVEQRMPARLPPPEALRREAMRGVREERVQRALSRGLVHLRTLYEIRVEETVASAR